MKTTLNEMNVGKLEIQDEKKSQILGQRHVQALLMFFGMVFGYFLRVNMSAAIVPLTKTNITDEFMVPITYGEPPTYDWSPSTKSLILSSFFWGYVAAQMPAGLLAKRYGAKIVLGLSTGIASILTLLHPVAIEAGGWKTLVTLRVFTGLMQGVVYPCIHTLLAKWVPRTERGFLSTGVYSGAQFGTTVILATSGYMFDSMGWPGIFYISGAISLTWSLIFLYFGANEPATSKYITKKEREYIESLTGSSYTSTEQLTIPWKAIFTSLPFLGLVAAQSGFTWGFYTLLTEIPTYMSEVLQLNVKSNALLSALPYFVMWLLCLIISPISDLLINRRIISVTVSRKLFNSIGQWVPMACLIGLGYMTMDQKVLAIALLTIGVGFNAASFCGYLVNHMDLSPNFAGVMMSISNGISNLCSIFAPLVVGAIVENEEDPKEWRIVFFITAGVYLFCNTLFIIFGKGTIQSWNEPTTTSNVLGRVSLSNQNRKTSTESNPNNWSLDATIDSPKAA